MIAASQPASTAHRSRRWPAVVLVVLAVAGLLAWHTLWMLPEGEMAVLSTFGRRVVPAIQTSGLHFKWPWQQVERLDARPQVLPLILEASGPRRPDLGVPAVEWRVDPDYADTFLARHGDIRNGALDLQHLLRQTLAAAPTEPREPAARGQEPGSTDATRALPRFQSPILAQRAVEERLREAAGNGGIDVIRIIWTPVLQLAAASPASRSERSVRSPAAARQAGSASTGAPAQAGNANGSASSADTPAGKSGSMTVDPARTAEVEELLEQAHRQADQLLYDAQLEAEELRRTGRREAEHLVADAHRQAPELAAFLLTLRTYEALLDGQTTLVLPGDSWLTRPLMDPPEATATAPATAPATSPAG